MEDVRGAINTILYGPAERFDEALEAIRAAGITAHRDRFEPEAISAFHHNGSEQPSADYVRQCEDRVRAAAEGTGFSVNRTSIWASSAATRKLPYNRHTGEWLEEFVNTETPLWIREEQLARLAERKAIAVTDIELRDPPELDIPKN